MAKAPAPEVTVLTAAQLQQLLVELRGPLPPATYQLVEGLLQTLQWVMEALEQKTFSNARLRRLIFGHKTEKARHVLPQAPAPEAAPAPAEAVPAQPAVPATQPKRRGHGRIGAHCYTAAERIYIPHPQLQAGGPCPECPGKLYNKTPCRIVCISAQPLFTATLYEGQSLRCHRCQKVFTATLPERAVLDKYDPNVGDMLGLLRFGAGLPNYRLASLQEGLGVPLPASTQWELMDQAARFHQPVWEALLEVGAQASLIHNDDTTMRVQSLRREILRQQDQNQRTGIFTTGLIAQVGEHQVALYFTGSKHAGENLDDLLRRRPAGLPKPLLMCDGLSRNHSKEFEVILCNCMSHSRRDFVDVVEAFPQQCRFVIESLGQLYAWDAQAKEQKLSPAHRLALHQEQSKPVMDRLHSWLNQQLEQKLVEPNSGLGEAIAYMLKHWEPLTRFLSVPGAPLDNNICERALKKAILHRKNSMSYRTLRGAQVGDLFMSLIQTCTLNRVNPWEYLQALRRHADQVRQHLLRWLPWNFHQNLPSCDSS